MPKTILHFIVELGRGGAEMMLVKVIRQLPEFRHLLVTLEANNQFVNEMEGIQWICLNKKHSLFSIPAATKQLRKIIKEQKPDLVHSHLPLCNFIARLGTPKSIPLITTIHTSISTAKDYKKWYIRFLDKHTFRFRDSSLIAVSQIVLDQYKLLLKINPKTSEVIHSFVDTDQFLKKPIAETGNIFKVITTGSLRQPKNHIYLLEAFAFLKNHNIKLHIYGEGPLKEDLQKRIDEEKLPVILKGNTTDVAAILPQYDLYCMSSLTEGFSVSVLEAMAVQLPLLLSDIPSFREQAAECALYFDLADPKDFVSKILLLKKNAGLRNDLAQKGNERVNENFNHTKPKIH